MKIHDYQIHIVLLESPEIYDFCIDWYKGWVEGTNIVTYEKDPIYLLKALRRDRDIYLTNLEYRANFIKNKIAVES